MKKIVQGYIADLKKEYKTGITVESSFRPALKSLLEELNPGYVATNELRRTVVGSPDFVITHNRKPIGYGETKDIGIDLDKVEKSKQIKGYLSLDNLFLTDYLEFRFFFNNKKYETIRIGKIENKKLVFDESKYEHLARMLKEFTDKDPITITSSLELTKLMANKAKLVKEIVHNAIAGEHDKDNLTDQYNAFREVLIHTLSKEEFADMYAQTITYGFFIARFFDKTLHDFTRHEAQELVPKSNPFLRQFFQVVAGADLDERIRWVVDDLASLFSYCDIGKIMKDFKKKNGQTDPVIHFYENFLGEYDPKLRKGRGVYYTPKPVVSFIVRSVDKILKKEFGLSEGLADSSKKTIISKGQGKTKKERNRKEEVHKLQILDPAVGTGTFLKEVIKEIHKKYKGQEGAWDSYVNENLIPRLHGFELMMAPYTICHLALGMELKRTGYNLKDKRLGVYLTNSLEPYDKDYETLFARWLSEESNKASKLKNEMPIMVVLGNPPYSVSSSNKGDWILKLIEDYKKDLNERKINIDDDYIKFIRMAENYIERNNEGIVAMITNNSFLDGITHRQMRKHLLETFDSIYILDLHGNIRKKETAPDGSKDENVFDIMQGVSISLFVKKSGKRKGLGKVFHSDLYGLRYEKYRTLEKSDIKNIKWEKIKYKEPYYFFVPKDFSSEEEYNKYFIITDLFIKYSAGIKTKVDRIATDMDKNKLKDRVKDILEGHLNFDEIRNKYGLSEKTTWEYNPEDNLEFKNENIISYNYRPLDNRFIYYDHKFLSRSRKEVMNNLLKDNYAISVVRQSKIDNDNLNTLITRTPTCEDFVTNHTFTFPLYLYYDDGTKTPNFNKEIFIKIIGSIKKKVTSENVLDYIYAVLHSPKYREKYKEFLKIDFPRVPYPKDEKQFFTLAKIGEELRQLHLLESPKVNKFITTYPVKGDGMVEKIRYEDGKVYINKEQYFGKVPESAWSFYIGGYQPAQKWLKDRKGRKLSSDDIKHYQQMIVALVETERLMGEIDKIIKF